MEAVYEKAGLFYLGKEVDSTTMTPTEALTLLKNKHFTTHAAIIGMTGSGKTGLGVDILEEAAIDNIPAIVIDPKGDMGNLCLVDPDFDPEHFLPWVEEEARAKGEEPEVYAQQIAQRWKEGIESWGQGFERAKRFAQVKKRIYTPGSDAGAGVNILSSLEVPPAEILQASDLFASYLKSTVSALLALIGEDADPLKSKPYALIAQILSHAWTAQENITLETLIARIITPPFKRIGVLPLERFYDDDARFALASRFNALLANPSFSAWMHGDAIDIDSLLYDEEGNAKVSIFTISHLNERERMFFVTLLLNRIVAWMRRQSGSSVLRALLYMDEIFGFFPPSKNPPSKEPMLLLLKQARAYGLGVVLSTQNPVDLDYKGLSNIGTWFIGRLQTSQDIDRVIEGLSGKERSVETSQIRKLLSDLPKRTFFLKSAHLEGIRLFTTRWVLSYLKGPLSRKEITAFCPMLKQNNAPSAAPALPSTNDAMQAFTIDIGVPQYYEPDPSGKLHYAPVLAAHVKLHYYQERRGIDETREKRLLYYVEGERFDAEMCEEESLPFERFARDMPKGARFVPLPAFLLEDKGLKRLQRELKNYLYRESTLQIYRNKILKIASRPDESYEAFVARVQERLKALKEEAIEKLQDRYAKKEDRLLQRLERAKARVEKEHADSTGSMIEAGIAILGALFGRTTPTKIGRAVSKGGKILKERSDMSLAQQKVEEIEEALEALNDAMQEEIEAISEKYAPENYPIETVPIKAKKSDIEIKTCAIVWRPLP